MASLSRAQLGRQPRDLRMTTAATRSRRSAQSRETGTVHQASPSAGRCEGMASSQAKPEAGSRFRFLRNPLKLLRPKGPLEPALGHVFDTDLACNRCGRMWHEQRTEPTECGGVTEATAPEQTDDDPQSDD